LENRLFNLLNTFLEVPGYKPICVHIVNIICFEEQDEYQITD